MIESNEPYKRVSRDNSTMEGGLIGMGVGAAGAGAFVGQSAMSYRGIDKRYDKTAKRLDDNIAFRQNNVDNLEGKMRSKMDKARPGKNMANKQMSAYNKYSGKINGQKGMLTDLSDRREGLNADKMREAHRYHKMGGWRNAAIIGGAAAVSGIAGSIADGSNN